MCNINHDEITKILSERGKQMVLYKGQKYNIQSVKEHVNSNINQIGRKIIWRCKKPKCRGLLHTNQADVVLKNTLCDHQPDYMANQVSYNLFSIAERGLKTNESARDIIYDALKDVSEEELANMPRFKSITNKMGRSRNRHRFPIDHVVSDIPSSVKTTSRGEVFLQYDSGINDENRIVIFCTDENLVHFSNAKIVLCDGTFKLCPPGFLQLYTFVSVLRGSNVPLVYI